MPTEYVFRDANGKKVIIDQMELFERLRAQGFRLYGLGVDEIAEMRRQYLSRGGRLKITVQSIKEVFDQTGGELSP